LSACPGQYGNLLLQSVSQAIPFDFQVVPALQIQPEAIAGLEVARQAKSGVCSDRAQAMDNLVDPARGDVQVLRGPLLTHTQGLEKLFQQDFTGMNPREPVFRHGAKSV